MARLINLYEYLKNYTGRGALKFVSSSQKPERDLKRIYNSSLLIFDKLEIEIIQDANFKAIGREALGNDLNIFVLETFEQNQEILPNAMLLGLPLLAKAIETRTVFIPEETSLLFCSALLGVKICIEENLHENELVKIKNLASWMQGSIQHHLDQATIFIASKVPAQEPNEPGPPSLFWRAVDYELPIYSLTWLSALYTYYCSYPCTITNESPTHEKFSSYILSPFEGVVVCGEFLSTNRQREMKRLVLGNGGTFKENFNWEDLHSVIVIEANARRQIAQQAINLRFFEYRVVSTQWIIDCDEAKKPLKLEKYVMRMEMFDNTDDNEDISAVLNDGPPMNVLHSTNVVQLQQEPPLALQSIHEVNPVEELENQEEASSDDEEDVEAPQRVQGIIFLCSCGYLVASHLVKSHLNHKYGRQLNYFVGQEKRKNMAVLGNYSFAHSKTILIKSNDVGKYAQIPRHTLQEIKRYVEQNITRLNHNQQIFNRLWEAGIREVESDDELDFEI